MAPREPMTSTTAPGPAPNQRLLAATEFLERLAADWSLLDQFPAEDRARLHRAIAGLSVAEPRAKRQRVRRVERQRREEQVRREEAVLGDTGIRTLRRRPAVTTPNVFPPMPADESGADRLDGVAGAAVADRTCYVCKGRFSQVHPFYDQLCPACAD